MLDNLRKMYNDRPLMFANIVNGSRGIYARCKTSKEVYTVDKVFIGRGSLDGKMFIELTPETYQLCRHPDIYDADWFFDNFEGKDDE